MLNIGFGSSGMTGRANMARGSISGETKPAQQTTVGAYKNTDELKFANSLSKSLNFGSFDNRVFAYHFVQRASGRTIRNLFEMFDAVLDILAERLDNDAAKDNDEYHCAVIAKRIQDALGKYQG